MTDLTPTAFFYSDWEDDFGDDELGSKDAGNDGVSLK